jgi:hypothetical protein
MKTSIEIAPPNSLLFISDQSGGTTPEIVNGESIWSTSSCVAVGCFTFSDGRTKVTLGAAGEVAPGRKPRYDGPLKTPSKSVVVSVVGGKPILQMAVQSQMTRVRIWTNHPTEPDEVIVGLGE